MMIRRYGILLLLVFLCISPLEGDLMEDLLVVDQINREINDRFPVTYNHYLQGGYINMPSARAGEAGEVAAGYAHLPPYQIISVRVQPYSFLEISANYRIYRGIDDPVLSPSGYGNFTDRGVNIKCIFLRPEDSDYRLPGFAVGADDVTGTCAFRSEYAVLTKVWNHYNFEASLGFGTKRIKGFFGGVQWTPWRKCKNSPLKGISFVAEYDATDYKKDPHPDGRSKKSSWNGGIKYNVLPGIDLSASIVRGKECALAATAYYNLGNSPGFLPRYRDPLPYCSPVNIQKVGPLRPYDLLIHELAFALDDQGFELIEGRVECGPCEEQILHLRVDNLQWLSMQETRSRLDHLLSRLIPINIDEVVVTITCEGFVCQEYRYFIRDLINFREQKIGQIELMTVSSVQEASTRNNPSTRIYCAPQSTYEWLIKPKIHNHFGNSSGKYKYAVGLQAGAEGYIDGVYYYQFLFGCIIKSELGNLNGIDRLNPSQIINVHSDEVLYNKHRGITLDVAFLQRGWSLGCGWYTRSSIGCFERAYGGIASEFLYYPVNSVWAIGFEAAGLRKRTFNGYGFSDKVRKLDGFVPHYKKFYGSQFFIDLYYDCQPIDIFFKVSGGKFLANDWGARFEASRYFDNGVEFSFWYTLTNGKDTINGKQYFDKGISFTIPLDIFYTYSSRERWTPKIAAWNRDVGYRSSTGNSLFDTIREQRE